MLDTGKEDSRNAGKPWLKSYPEGVNSEIDQSQFESLIEMFEATFKKSPQAPAFECMGVSITYAQLDIASRKFAAYLQSLGLKPGARVALMMPNVLQYPIALMGVLRAGCVVVNVNPLYTHNCLKG